MPMSEQERKATYELGRIAGIAEEHLRGIQGEIHKLCESQTALAEQVKQIYERLESLNNWRWVVVGFATAMAFLASLVVSNIKSLLKW